MNYNHTFFLAKKKIKTEMRYDELNRYKEEEVVSLSKCRVRHFQMKRYFTLPGMPHFKG